MPLRAVQGHFRSIAACGIVAANPKNPDKTPKNDTSHKPPKTDTPSRRHHLYTVDLGVSRQNGQNRQRFRRSNAQCPCAARIANLRGVDPGPIRSPQENPTGISHDMSVSSQLAAHNHIIEYLYIIPIEISNIPYNPRSTRRTQHIHIRSGSFQHGSNQSHLYQQVHATYTPYLYTVHERHTPTLPGRRPHVRLELVSRGSTRTHVLYGSCVRLVYCCSNPTSTCPVSRPCVRTNTCSDATQAHGRTHVRTERMFE